MPHCVKGQANAGVHVKQYSTKNAVPTVSMDYFYDVKAEEDHGRGPPTIAIVDDRTGLLKSSFEAIRSGRAMC